MNADKIQPGQILNVKLPEKFWCFSHDRFCERDGCGSQGGILLACSVGSLTCQTDVMIADMPAILMRFDLPDGSFTLKVQVK